MSVNDWEIACPNCGSATPKQRPTCISCDAPLGDLFEPPTRRTQRKASAARITQDRFLFAPPRMEGRPEIALSKRESEEPVKITVTPGKVLCFTPDSLIVAKHGSIWITLLPWFGIAGGLIVVLVLWWVRKRIMDRSWERVQKLSPESILTANKKNFAIPYTEITKIEVFKRRRFYLWWRSKLRITAGAAEHEFWLEAEEYRYYRRTLPPVLADKLV